MRTGSTLNLLALTLFTFILTSGVHAADDRKATEKEAPSPIKTDSEESASDTEEQPPEIGQDADPKTKARMSSFAKEFASIKKMYRRGEIKERVAWQRLAKLYNTLRKGLPVNPSEVLQTQAYIIKKSKLPLLAAKYSSMAIMAAKDPFSESVEPSWDLLDKTSRQKQVHDLLIELAQNLGDRGTLPPAIKNNWNYFYGEALLRQGNADQAIAHFEKLNIEDRYYLAARYQLAMTLLLEKNDPAKATVVLKAMISPDIRPRLKTGDLNKRRYFDHAYLALGRIQYESQKFASSVKYFRSVSRTSPFYYNALAEQSWAFFLAGYPNHALGALHSVESPYFSGRFNPEVPVLRSIVYYWMCRYDDSKAALAEFISKYSDSVNELEKFLEQKSLTPEKSYQLFEDMISGVTSQSLGLDRNVLEHVSKSEPMVYVRDKLATVLDEQEKLKKKGIFGSKKAINFPQEVIDNWLSELSKELGQAFIIELVAMRDAYREFRSQANFIYIELLMSEKEQALGRELHGSSKIEKVDLKSKAKGWGRASVPWRASDLGEYWWDEVGFYVYQLEPNCNQIGPEE